MKLSSRLQAIADFVPDNSQVFDVGCDHALLDIYLTRYRRNIKAIAMDVNPRVIKTAKENIAKHNLTEQIPVMEKNGIEDLQFINKNDVVVISGMGTSTILKILAKAKSFPNTFVLQSNNDQIILRKKMMQLGYVILSEHYLIEKKKHYVIIKFQKGRMRYHYSDYVIGPYLKYNQSYLEYLHREKTKKYSHLSWLHLRQKWNLHRMIHVLRSYMSE